MGTSAVSKITRASIAVQNVVASANLNQEVDLNKIARCFCDVEYHPDRFPGLVFRTKIPKASALIFSTGKMVCTGARSSEHAEVAVRKVVEKLRMSGIEIVSEPVVTMQNVVATADLGGKVHLLEAARRMPKSMYEPEQFAGLIHRMEDPKCVILLFASGRAV